MRGAAVRVGGRLRDGHGVERVGEEVGLALAVVAEERRDVESLADLLPPFEVHGVAVHAEVVVRETIRAVERAVEIIKIMPPAEREDMARARGGPVLGIEGVYGNLNGAAFPVGDAEDLGALHALIGVVEVAFTLSERVAGGDERVLVEQLRDPCEQFLRVLGAVAELRQSDDVVEVVEAEGQRGVLVVEIPHVLECDAAGKVVIFTAAGNFQLHEVIADLPAEGTEQAGAHIFERREERLLTARQRARGRRAADGIAEPLKAEGGLVIDSNPPADIMRLDADALRPFVVVLKAVVELPRRGYVGMSGSGGKQGKENE